MIKGVIDCSEGEVAQPLLVQLTAEEIANLYPKPLTKREQAFKEIERLEKMITPRRLRDAVLSDQGKSWLTNIELLIKAERAKF